MRIQVLELPTVVVGDEVTTPFALIFDQCPEPERTLSFGGDVVREDFLAIPDVRDFADNVGASGYFCTAETVDLVDPVGGIIEVATETEEEEVQR